MKFLTDRRSVLIGAGALGATSLLGLSGQPLRAGSTPQKGGTFRFAIADFDSGETLDPQVNESKFMQCLQYQIRNPLIEIGPGGVLIPELATEWEGNDASTVWVEAAPAAEEVEGMPFRNLNDGVTPVVIGGNDWASAWAMQENGQPMYPVGRGIAGERQREMAIRFGVNLIMHVMTGNYKSDQVHVPALLDRLGQ